MKERFLYLLEEVLEKDRNSIKMEDSFRDYEEWDSLAVLALIATVDGEYGFTIPQESFKDLQTVENLYNYILQNVFSIASGLPHPQDRGK